MALPALRAVAHRPDHVERMALRAGRRQEVAAFARRQRALGAGGHGDCDRKGGSAERRSKPAHHTPLVRRSATEKAGCQVLAAPMPSRWVGMSRRDGRPSAITRWARRIAALTSPGSVTTSPSTPKAPAALA